MPKQFEVLGYFEEYYVKDASGAYKFKGCARLAAAPPGRKIGSDGMEDCVLTEPVTLDCQMNHAVIKASAKKPVEARTIVYPLNGRLR